jgi:hypothetical protein
MPKHSAPTVADETDRHLRRAHLSWRRVSSRVSRQCLRARACGKFGEALHDERDRRHREGHEHREGSEFLTSTDERFRPVNACNGPDGALYLVDMYRGIIQHQSFLTHYLIANIEARKLEQPFNHGPHLAHRARQEGTPPVVKVSKDVKLLAHANGWVRDTAQRLIVESGDASHRACVERDAAKRSALARLHALWTLDGLAAITPDLLRPVLTDKDTQVRAAAVRIAPRDLAPDLIAITTEKQPLVLAHLASSSPRSICPTPMPPWRSSSPAMARTPWFEKAHSRDCAVKRPRLPRCSPHNSRKTTAHKSCL